MKNFTLTMLIFVFSSIILKAQIDTTQEKNIYNLTLHELMQIKVYTASKISQKATDAPATVYVVTKQQIEQRSYSCLKELLDDIPQVEIQQKSVSGSTDRFTLNGIAGNEKFVILMDGIRINSTTGTEHTLGESYSLVNVKQVEIILGPASSLYGADAFTGIINIITNKGYENKGIYFSSSYGLYNTTDNTLVCRVGNKKISFSFTGKYYHSNEPFFPDYYPDEYGWYNHYTQTGEMQIFGNTFSPAFNIKPWSIPTDAYTIHAKFNFKKIEIGYSRFFESHSSAFGSPPSTSIYAKESVYVNHLQNLYATHNFVSKNKKIELNSTISSQEFKVYPHSLFFNQYAGYLDAYKYERNRTIKIEEQLNYYFSDKFTAVGGISYEFLNAIPKTSDLPYKFDETKSTDEQNIYYPGTNITDLNGNDLTIMQDFYNLNYYNIGSYLQIQYHAFEKLIITAGTRYDYNSQYKSTLNPRIGFVYKPINKIVVKLLFGQAYLAPSPSKSHTHFGSFYQTTNDEGEITGLASSFWQLINENLEPEKRTSYDIYSIYQINMNFAISINGYLGQISNLITRAGYDNIEFQGIPVDYVSKTVNKGDAIAYGGTFRFDYKGVLVNHLNVNIFAAYSYSDGKIDENPLIFSAKHTIKSGIGIRYKKFNIYIKTLYRTGSHSRTSTIEEPIMNKPFTLINLTAKYKIINKPKFKASLFINVFNLLNSKHYNAGYEDFKTTPQDPIRFNFGLKLNI